MQVQFNVRNKKLLEENCVIVRIWASEHNLHTIGENVGHVSLYLLNEDKYVSLWPKHAVRNPFKDKVDPEFVLNYEEDLKREGRPPEKTYYFYTLNTENMSNKFKQLKNSVEGWCLFGGCTENLESCVSLAWTVLEAGNISKLISKIKSSNVISRESTSGAVTASGGAATSNKENISHGFVYSVEQAISPFVKSPDALITQLQIAKETEIKRYPLTTEFEITHEINQNKKVKTNIPCAIM